MASANVVNVTDASFGKDVLESTTPVLVDFWAVWCAPCRALAPTVDALADEYAGKLKVCKMDVDSNPGVPGKLGIRGIPTVIVFKGGQEVDRIVGVVPKASLAAKLAAHM